MIFHIQDLIFLFSLCVQQAVQEKFRQASENLDSLNKWLDQVEREIAGQEVPREDSDQLRTQINTLKVSLYLVIIF
jgi:hypothetical protein